MFFETQCTLCSKCNVKLGWFKMRQQNFIVCEPKFTSASTLDVEWIVIANAVFRLWITISVQKIHCICDQSLKLSDNAQTVD